MATFGEVLELSKDLNKVESLMDQQICLLKELRRQREQIIELKAENKRLRDQLNEQEYEIYD